jgi:hypothetical protein
MASVPKTDDAPAQPKTKSEQPEAKSEQPEAKSEQPGAKSEQPEAKSEQPGAAERRVRRTRQVAVPEEPDAGPADAAPGHAPPADGAPARPERPGRREGRPARERTRRRRKRPEGEGGRGGEGGDRSIAAITGQRRKVYRQDAPKGVVPPPEKTEEQKRTDAKAEARRKAQEQSKITLLLHPAPKAVPISHKKKKGPKTAKEALVAKSAKRRKGGGKSGKSSKARPEVELTPAWLKADAAGAEAALKEAGAGAEALIRAWQEANNAGAIAAAASSSLEGPTRKAARRALNVLKSRGVEIPQVAESTSAPKPKKVEECSASFVPPDNAGMVFFSITQRQPTGRYHVADVVLREPQGVLHASSGFIARKQIRQWQKRIEERYGTLPVDVPLDWARYRIAAARKRNDETKQLVPLGFDTCAPLLTPAPADEVAHPMAELEAKVTDSDVEKARGDSDRLHEEPEFQSWLPDRPAIDEMLSLVGQRVGADGIEDSDKVDEALKIEVSSATDRFFLPETRAFIADRMRDSAISVHSRLGEDAARRVLAVARAVREAGLVTAPPSEVPFLRRYFQKAIAILVHQGKGRLQVPIPRQPAAEAEAEQATPA